MLSKWRRETVIQAERAVVSQHKLKERTLPQSTRDRQPLSNSYIWIYFIQKQKSRASEVTLAAGWKTTGSRGEEHETWRNQNRPMWNPTHEEKTQYWEAQCSGNTSLSKYGPYKHEDHSLGPQHPHKQASMMVGRAWNPAQEQWEPEARRFLGFPGRKSLKRLQVWQRPFL